MNRLKEISELKRFAEENKLENAEIIGKYRMNELCAIYNGIGPDSFPEWLRNIVSELHPSLKAAALIHDIEWHESNGSEKEFSESNERFKRNGIRSAKAKYCWIDPRRYIVSSQAIRFGKLCQMFGFSGWKALKQRSKVPDVYCSRKSRSSGVVL